jgi:hypothetical protein
MNDGYKKIIAWLTLVGVIRGVIEIIWYYKVFNPVTALAAYSMLLYSYTLYGSLAYLTFSLLDFTGSRFKPGIQTQKKFYWVSAFVWVIYPLVPIVTILTGDSYSKTIPLFAHIPFFMVNSNFLPTGMMFVIPIITISYIFICRSILKTGFVASVGLTAFSCTVMYLLFYQFFLRLFVGLRHSHNYFVAYAVYHTLMMVFLYFSTKRFYAVYGAGRRYANIFLIANEALMLVLLVYGCVK